MRPSGGRVLIVSAVAAERAAVLRGLSLSDRAAQASAATGRIVAHVGGIGVAAAAASTARLLAAAEFGGDPFEAVFSIGIAGGFPDRAAVGATVVATRSIAADLGAASAEGFAPLDDMGLGISTVDIEPVVLAELQKALPDAVVGDVLTVATVTGTAERAAQLLARHPTAVAEAMEGFGVASAASQAGVAFAEIRTISNAVGPRDRAAWRIGDALSALSATAAALAGAISPGSLGT